MEFDVFVAQETQKGGAPLKSIWVREDTIGDNILCPCSCRKNNIFEYVADQRSGFPADRFKEVTGQKKFVDEQSMVMKL